MAWPNDVVTRTVTGTYLNGAGEPAKGRITFTPTSRIVDTDDNVIVEGAIVATLDENGSFSIELPTTDNLLLSPQGWAYEVNVRLYGVKPRKFYALLPVGDGSAIDLATGASVEIPPKSTSVEAAIEAISSQTFAAYDQSTDSDVTFREVYGTYLTATGEAAKGRVTFTPTHRVVDTHDAVIIEDTVSAVLDDTGTFSISLPTTDNLLLSPRGWAYEVNVRLYGVRPYKYFAFLPIGDGTPVDLINDISTGASGVADGTIQSGSAAGGQGSIGPRGPGVITGVGLPASTTGFDGDIYIDSEDGAFYGPKANGEWPLSPFYTPQSLGAPRYVHTQSVASATWNVVHELGGRPSVTVVDTAGTVVIGQVSYNSNTSITISFSAPFAGYAYLT